MEGKIKTGNPGRKRKKEAEVQNARKEIESNAFLNGEGEKYCKTKEDRKKVKREESFVRWTYSDGGRIRDGGERREGMRKGERESRNTS